MMTELAFWMTLAHDLTPFSFSQREGWKTEAKMNLIIKFHHEKKITISEFFELSAQTWKTDYELTDWQIDDLKVAAGKVSNNSFLAEHLMNNGIEIITRISADYPEILKNNLKKSSPIILYTKGNKKILTENCVAIVGSRDASSISLTFTDNVAKKMSENYNVIASGFAKGVDKQALDSSIKYIGQSIIVLPQGILTFESGMRTYYQQILSGNVLVLSVYQPKAGWSTELAMARNSIIYGLAHEIYVAESKPSRTRQGGETKGGTWAGAIDGLKKNRKVFVRLPEQNEKNDNLLLIEKGGIPVDINGNIVENDDFTGGAVQLKLF
jgi:predicted Rossmann fold nucleotide-binding protein DprA/Smf involved in DNA uptake